MDDRAMRAPAPAERPPRSLELVLATNEVVNIDLEPLPSAEELEVVIDILVEEHPPAYFWTALASRCWNAGRRDEAALIVTKGCELLPVHRPEESVPLFALHAAFQLADARSAPKQVLPDARFQQLGDRVPKDRFLRSTIEALNHAQTLDPQHPHLILTRAVFALATGDNALATKLFDAILAREPTHAVARLGRACILLRSRQYVAALREYQGVLRVSIRVNELADAAGDPSARWAGPDARVGIGLCLAGLGHHDAARRAWRRAAAVDPSNHAPRLLLGLALVNMSRQVTSVPHGWFGANTELTEDVARRAAYAEGTTLLQSAWVLNKTSAMTAVALSAHLLSQATHALAQALPAAGDMSSKPAALTPESAAAASSALDRALKLSEHAVQYADARGPVVQAWLQLARALHLASELPQHVSDHGLRIAAQRYYSRALEVLTRTPATSDDAFAAQLSGGLALAALGLAQMQISTGDAVSATATLDAVLGRPAAGSSASFAVEPGLLAGLVYAQPPAGSAPDEAQASLRRARTQLDRTLRVIDAAGAIVSGPREADELSVPTDVAVQTALENEHLGPLTLAALSRLGGDARVHAQLASLWAPGDRIRAASVYAHALRLSGSDAALSLNIGALLVLQGLLQRDSETGDKGVAYLRSAAAPNTDGAIRALAQYNLGRAHECAGRADAAREAYGELLGAHPEFVDARVRLAVLAAHERADKQLADSSGTLRTARETANSLFKEALSSEPANLDTRAMYMRFLAGEYPANRHAGWPAVKDIAAQLFLGPDAGKGVFGSSSAARHAVEEARHDAYTLGALGWAYYQLGLHVAPGANARAERAKAMLRAADLLDKALAANTQDVFAAQGLAIIVADDALGDPNATPEASAERRRSGAEDAIALFGKLREVRDDASVHVCLGHAFMVRSELERAIDAYELAMRRYGNERNAAILQYLARAEYALGLRDKNLTHIQTALERLRVACSVLQEELPAGASGDHALAVEAKQATYNMAVMAQKALHMLYELPPERKRVSELEEAIGWVEQAQGALESLVEAARKGQLAYITAEVVEQRIKYAETSLLRNGAKHLDEAREYAAAQEAHRKRLGEKQREKDAQMERLRQEKEEELRRRAEAIAENRKRAREEASKIEYIREPSPEREPKKRGGGGKGRRKNDQQENFVVSDEEPAQDAGALFEESDSDDNAGGDDAQESDKAQDSGDDDERDTGEVPPDTEPETSEAPQRSGMRAKLEALAQQRKQRSKEERRSKKRSGETAEDGTPKKPKV